MIDMLPLVFVTFIMVFLRAIQSQNVIGGHYIAAAITPYGIAFGEVMSVLLVVNAGWAAIPYVGTGGALGAIAAMWVHRRMTRHNKR